MKLFFLVPLILPLFSLSQTASSFREKAKEAFSNDDPELAIKFINEAIKLSPTNCDYYAFRALYSTSRKRNIENYKTALSSALDDMTKAINLGCNDAQDYKSRADFYIQIGLTEKAKNDYQKALLILKNPSSHWDFSERAGIKTSLEDYKGAISDYTSAIQLDTTCNSCFRLYGLRAHCKAKIQDFVGALADYTKNLQLNSSPSLETGEVYCNRGIVKLNMNNIKGACEDWREASNLGYMKSFDFIKQYCH